MRAALVLMVAIVLGLGCHARQHAPPTRTGLTHVVVFWLKNPGDASARQRVIAASENFRSIPGVISVDAGQVVPTERPNVDKTYDVGVVIRFRDRESLEQYQVHPKHRAMLEQLGPLIDHTVAYDFR